MSDLFFIDLVSTLFEFFWPVFISTRMGPIISSNFSIVIVAKWNSVTYIPRPLLSWLSPLLLLCL